MIPALPIRPVLGTSFLIGFALFHAELQAQEKAGSKPVVSSAGSNASEPSRKDPQETKEEEKKKEDSPSKSQASDVSEKGNPKPEGSRAKNPATGGGVRDSSSAEGLRLDVGGGGLLLGPPDGASGGTSLGPLPDFKRSSPPQEEPVASEEPAFPDIEMRRRARPDLVPEGPNATEEAAVALRDRIRYRSVKTQALRDGAVREALEASVKARSEREMREALKRHYTLLFAKMRALDSSLKELITERETETFQKLRERLPR
jgi:hypothetical protein